MFRAHALCKYWLTLSLLAGACAIGPPADWPDARPLRALDGFVVEQVYGVPRAEQGSWVSLAVDDRGALVASAEKGGLYRIEPAPIGAAPSQTRVVSLRGATRPAHGLLHAFDSLYVVRNQGMTALLSDGDNGLYRLRGEVFDQVELLRRLTGAGEHGPHQLVVAPDGESLFLIAGNDTLPTDFAASRIAAAWREDQLLPVIPNWRILNLPPPGGWVARLDPHGGEWELFATGFRNPYDLAFNRAGDLFTFDADMEWDIGAPWYRPTRLLHVRSGGEYGWRKGSAKWPDSFLDSLGAVLDVGTGSPTGMVFGYGAAFPERYEQALFLLDWSQGKIYAAHLEPRGSSYTATLEPFVVGQPLPVTDVVIHPIDRTMYFSTGGRDAASGIYRVRYVGSDPVVDPATATTPLGRAPNELHALRRRLETLHTADAPGGVEQAWPNLSHSDRGIRYAARVAIEHQDPADWRERAWTEPDAGARINASIALARSGAKTDRDRGLQALLDLDWSALGARQRFDALRALSLWLSRHGRPTGVLEARIVSQLDALYPARSFEESRALSELLVFLEAPSAIAKTLDLLQGATTQEEQIHYASVLRVVDDGWTRSQRDRYFAWIDRALDFHGGAALEHFIESIEDDARSRLPLGERVRLSALFASPPDDEGPRTATPEGPGRSWTTAELEPLLAMPLSGRSHARGEAMFGAGACFTCHRFAGRGGAVGPDLTTVGSRFSPMEIAESIVEPGRTISDQYAAVEIRLRDGEVITGRIVNVMGNLFGLRTEGFVISTDMMTSETRLVRPEDVDSIQPSGVSMMPPGLANAMNQDELLDLIAYLVSSGDPTHSAFR